MKHLLVRNKYKFIGLIIGIGVLFISFLLSIKMGLTQIDFKTVFNSFFSYNSEITNHIIIRSSRLPRAIIASLVGSSLAIAGALMQAITRNPLASPSIMGINAGALFAVTIAITIFSVSSLVNLMWIAFLGAGLAAFLVYILSSIGREGLTSMKIILAGAAITALFVSITQGILVLNETGLQEVLFWIAGSVSGRSIDMLLPILPFIIIASVTAFLLSNSINIMAAGDDIARGLGQKVIYMKVVLTIIFVILAGSSVAIAGQIIFVGLMVPHIAKLLVGLDYKWVIPYSSIIGASLVLISDVISRFVIMPSELPIGVVTALLGTPFFIYITRKGFNQS
ncbi:MAG: iron ABC transporter permease [Halanaerobiales bacterium]|nr:iron ABC transporter permease [Halanaerobiales bacterium]